MAWLHDYLNQDWCIQTGADTVQHPYFNKRIAYVEQISRQYVFIFLSAIIFSLHISPFLWIYIFIFIVMVIYSRTFLSLIDEDLIPNPPPPDLNQLAKFLSVGDKDRDQTSDGRELFFTNQGLNFHPVPPYTIFLPSRSIYSNDYRTLSFYFFNIIFYPDYSEKKEPDEKRCALLHEFAHCGRGEFVLLYGAIFLAASPIIGGPFILIFKPDFFLEHPEYVTKLICLPALVLCLAGQFIRRQEFIADYRAYEIAGNIYISKFIKNNIFSPTLKRKKPKQRIEYWGDYFWRFYKWHPSWKSRFDFLNNQDHIPASDRFHLMFSAFIVGLLPSLATPLVALAMIIYIGWIIARGAKTLSLNNLVQISFFVCLSLAVGILTSEFFTLYSLLSFIDFKILISVYFRENLHVWYVSLVWFLLIVSLLIYPITRESSIWVLTSCIFASCIFSFYSLGYDFFYVSHGFFLSSYYNLSSMYFTIFSWVTVVFLVLYFVIMHVPYGGYILVDMPIYFAKWVRRSIKRFV